MDRIDPPAQNLTGRSGRPDANLAGAVQIEIQDSGTRWPGYFFVKRAALGGATFSGGRSTMAPLSHAASHR
jgi:hypothetical protein